jgi:hypothetical protein
VCVCVCGGGGLGGWVGGGGGVGWVGGCGYRGWGWLVWLCACVCVYVCLCVCVCVCVVLCSLLCFVARHSVPQITCYELFEGGVRLPAYLQDLSIWKAPNLHP